jgi:hypothetical protein
VEKEFKLAFIDFSFNWFEAFSCVGEDLQVMHICSCLGGGVGRKHYSVVASDMCENEGRHGNISRFHDSFVDRFEGIVSGGDGISDWYCDCDNDLPFSARRGFRDNGSGHRLLVFAHDSHKRFVLLAYTGVEAISPRQVFGQVSPDV